jgi:hypothetical protein
MEIFRFHAPALYVGKKNPRIPVYRRISGYQNQSGNLKEEKKFLSPKRVGPVHPITLLLLHGLAHTYEPGPSTDNP